MTSAYILTVLIGAPLAAIAVRELLRRRRLMPAARKAEDKESRTEMQYW